MVNPEEVMRDLSEGMNDLALMEKHGLSANQLQVYLKKWSASGGRVQPIPDEQGAGTEGQGGLAWVCPACRKPQLQQFEECPQCGVLVSKYARHQETKAAEAENREKRHLTAIMQILRRSCRP